MKTVERSGHASPRLVGPADPFAWTEVEDTVQAAWRESILAELPERTAERLLAESWVAEVPAGEVFFRGGSNPDAALLGIVADGLVRTYMQAPDGRQVTVRYAGRGALVGIPALLLDELAADVDAQAVYRTHILRLPQAAFRSLVRRDPAVAWPIARYLAAHIAHMQQLLAADLFMGIRARVALHLLDLAVTGEAGPTVTATHQDVADAIGSVREVVSRAIKRLQDEGMVERIGTRMVIRDASALRRVAESQAEVG